MKKIIMKAVYFLLCLVQMSAWADLPQPPSGDMANSSQNWIEAGKIMLFKLIEYACIAGGALVIIGVAFNIFSAYHVAQEKQDLGHFFKHLMVGLLVAAVASGLIYVGYTTVQD